MHPVAHVGGFYIYWLVIWYISFKFPFWAALSAWAAISVIHFLLSDHTFHYPFCHIHFPAGIFYFLSYLKLINFALISFLSSIFFMESCKEWTNKRHDVWQAGSDSYHVPESFGEKTDQVPVFISPRNRVAQLYPRTLGSLFVASYDTQGLRWRYSNPPPHGVRRF
jgi:hypothetical protein